MADIAPEDNKPKRRLKTMPVTVRQRNEQLQNKSDLQDAKGPGAGSSLARGFTFPIRKLYRAIESLGRFKFFRILSKILLITYIRDSWRELRKVSWPGWKQSWQLTYAVIVFSIIFGILIAAIDFGLNKLFKEIILK